MLEILHAIGPNSWVSGGDPVARREAMQELFFDYPVCPEETGEDWPEDRELYSEMVVVDDAGHAASEPGIVRELVRATDMFDGTQFTGR